MITEKQAKHLLQNMPNVSRETFERFETFNELLLKWTAKINLISKSQGDRTWARHILDSAQVWAERPDNHKVWVDIGTGGGFPGLILAVIADGIDDNTEFHFVESDARKCAFLRSACRELNLTAQVHTARIEEFDSVSADVVSARALSSIDALLGYASGFLKQTGVCLFLKGAACDTEITQAKQNWLFDYNRKSSMTSPDGVLLTIKDINRAE